MLETAAGEICPGAASIPTRASFGRAIGRLLPAGGAPSCHRRRPQSPRGVSKSEASAHYGRWKDAHSAYGARPRRGLRPYWEGAWHVAGIELRLLKQAVRRAARTTSPAFHAGLNLLAATDLGLPAIPSKRGDYAQRALQEAGDQPGAPGGSAASPGAALTLGTRPARRLQSREASMKRSPGSDCRRRGGRSRTRLRVQGHASLPSTASMQADPSDPRMRCFEAREALYRRSGRPRWSHRVLLQRVGCLAGLKPASDEARQLLAKCEQYSRQAQFCCRPDGGKPT